MTDPSNLIEIPFGTALSERYLAYAMSTITSRSLPDVRDGLKPVHRRLLFAMRQLKLNPDSGYKKCARVVGDVIGKYHPHGDQSVYDALVRLAQDFAVRYPLVDGQGNFGNIDGDNAAAMRYTESRLTPYAEMLMEGLDEDAVDYRPTYDGEEREPIVMPAVVPNLLANGAAGIAVGMATNIPSHNLHEVCAALLLVLENDAVTLDELLAVMPGPDFATGGIIVESAAAIREAYATGRGGFRVRAKWETEDTGRGQYRVIVTEIPPQVQKSKLIEKIAELIAGKKLAALLADVADESTEDIRIVLTPKSRTVEPGMLMEALFRSTDLESRFSLNMNLLDADQVPRVMSLKEVLDAFLAHRFVVLQRRSRHRLEKIEHRLEILGGYLIAYLNLDEVIAIIRESDEPKKALVARFELSEVQAEAILNMRLRALRKLEEIEIRREYEALEAERDDLYALLDSKARQKKVIATSLKDIQKRFGSETMLGKRRTAFAEAPSATVISFEAMIEKEPVTIICSEKGWIRALKGHAGPDTDVKFKEGDRARFSLHAQTTDKILLFATNGRFYTLDASKLPGGRGHGEPVRLMVDLPNEEDIVTVLVYDPAMRLILAAADGKGFMTPAENVVAQTKNGKQIMTVAPGVEAAVCVPVTGDTVAVAGENRKILIFPLEEMPEMTRGRGAQLQKYRDGGLADLVTLTKADGLQWKMGDRTRTEPDLTQWWGRRGGSGRMAPRGFPQSNKFA
jgi:topoisomerase-4 subunit A